MGVDTVSGVGVPGLLQVLLADLIVGRALDKAMPSFCDDESVGILQTDISSGGYSTL